MRPPFQTVLYAVAYLTPDGKISQLTNGPFVNRSEAEDFLDHQRRRGGLLHRYVIVKTDAEQSLAWSEE